MGYLESKTSYEYADADGNRGIYVTFTYCSNCHEEVCKEDLEYDEETETYFCPECGEEIDPDYEPDEYDYYEDRYDDSLDNGESKAAWLDWKERNGID